MPEYVFLVKSNSGKVLSGAQTEEEAKDVVRFYERNEPSYKPCKIEKQNHSGGADRNMNSFQNGRNKAEQEIQNAMDKLKKYLEKGPAADEAAGYKDRINGFYDKWYRYNRSDDGAAYDRGCKKAVDSGKCPDHFQLIPTQSSMVK
jgi:hypothetical protein